MIAYHNVDLPSRCARLLSMKCLVFFIEPFTHSFSERRSNLNAKIARRRDFLKTMTCCEQCERRHQSFRKFIKWIKS